MKRRAEAKVLMVQDKVKFFHEIKLKILKTVKLVIKLTNNCTIA